MEPQLGAGAGCQAEKGERSLCQDDAGHADLRPAPGWAGPILGRMWRKKHAQAAGAQGRGPHPRTRVAHGHHLRPHQAGIASPAADGQGQHQSWRSPAQEGGKGDGQQNAGRARNVFMAKVVRAMSIQPPR